MVSETLELIIRTSGASAASQQIGSIGSQARTATAGVNSLNESLAFMRKTLVALSFIRVFEGLASGISQAQAINNQLIQIAKNASDVPKAFNMFENIALATHAPLAAVTGLGVQIARSSSAYKASAKDIALATETIFNTFRLNGSDPATISNVTKDLKEIFSLGVVQGRQFRAVILQDQAEALLLAKHLHASGAGAVQVNKELDAIRARGEMPDMYEMAMKHKGAFTGNDMFNANVEANKETSEQAARTVTTLGQAFTDLQNKWLGFLNMVQNTGAFKPVVDFVEFISQHIPVIVAFVSAIAGLFIINALTGALLTFGSGAGAVFSFLTASVRNLMALFRAFFVLVTSEAGALVLPFILLGFVVAATFHKQIGEGVDYFGTRVKEMGGWMEYLIRFVSTFAALVQTVFGNLGDVVGNLFVTIINGVVATFQFALNKIIEGVNFIGTKLNTVLPQGMQVGQIKEQNFGRMDNPYGANLQQSFQQNFAKDYKFMEGMKSKIAGMFSANTGTPEFKMPGKPAAETEIVKDRANKMRDALQTLEDMLSRFAGPAKKFQDDIDKFSTKIKDWTTATHDAKGNVIPALLTNTAVAAKFAAAGFDDYNSKTHQSIELNQAMAREVLGLKNTSLDFKNTQDMVNKALEIHAIDQAQANKLIEDATRKRDLYNLSLLGTAEAGIEIAKIKFAQNKGGLDDIGEKTATKALEFDQQSNISTYTTQTDVLGQMLAKHTISAQAYAESIYDIQKAYLSTSRDGIGGFQQGLLEVQRTMFDTAGDAAKVLTDSFQGLQDTLVTFATTGKMNVHNMAMSILTDMDTMIVKQAIMQPLISSLGFGPGSNLGIGQPNGALGSGGVGGFVASLFGGSSAGAAGQLGSSAALPLFVSVVPGIGGIPGAGGDSSGGLMSMLGGSGGSSDGGSFFSNLFSGTGGGAGSTSSGILDTLTSIGSLFGFATGGDFMVGGQGGTDSQLVAFRASPDERVTVHTPQQQRAAQKADSSISDVGGIHVHLHGVQDFDSFKRSSGQLTAGVGAAVSRAARRNGN